VLSSSHPATAESQEVSAAISRTMKEPDRAKLLEERARAIRRQK
jgi:hypothetical protein